MTRLEPGDPGYVMQADRDYANGVITMPVLLDAIRYDAQVAMARRATGDSRTLDEALQDPTFVQALVDNGILASPPDGWEG